MKTQALVSHNENYSDNFWIELTSFLEENSSEKLYAAFDADGTLWNTDLGEGFFKYQIQNKLLTQLPENPWTHYRNMKAATPPPAYLWLAQVNAGRPINEIRQWAQDYVNHIQPMPLFKEQQKLIQILHRYHVKVFVVTASIKWSVEPGAKLYQIPQQNVLGVQTEVHDGLITDIQEGPITWKNGKIQALLQQTQGVAPFLCCGNTMGDISLLEAATKFSIAVTSVDSDHELFGSEMELQKLATQRGWIAQKL